MAKIISIINPKGGCGKTTLSTNISRGLQKRNFSVIIGDCDQQGSARDWYSAGGDESDFAPVYGIDRPQLVRGIAKVADDKDFVIIDGPATDMAINAETVVIADIVMIPINPSPYDIWACGELVDLVKTRQSVANGRPVSRFVITRQKPNASLSAEVRNALEDQGVNLFRSCTYDREIYKQTASRGQTVFEGHNKSAKEEVDLIIDEIIEITRELS
ncbi:MAG: AAA family ATPase [Gammaproteobacteria bacterium]|nr:AAA family ATPase [Gammaproteobacteria bacterium]